MKTEFFLNKYCKELLLASLFLMTFLFGLNSYAVERFYATGIYVFISNFFRICFGWIPFSFGDLLYGFALLIIIANVVRFIKLWRRKELIGNKWLLIARKFLRVVMTVYLVFQWLWGLNYHRLGSAYQLMIDPGTYTTVELEQLTDTLNSRLHEIIPQITRGDSAEWLNFPTMKNRCIADYSNTAKIFPFVQYKHPSVKQMVIGIIGGYGGFSGYLNPFTGEAQLNANVPPFLRPYVTCHEIGHQLGYAAEEEANMIGYLVARQSTNPAVRYSVYHDLMTYASLELYYADSNAYHVYVDKLPPLAKQHSKQARDYYASFRSPVQSLVNQWYDLYLKANSQSKGLQSYNYITAWLIAYAKKYGWQNI